MTQDDLTPWQDTPLVQALTAAGRDDELTGKDKALAAFRAAPSSRRRRGALRYLGTGMTSVVLLGAVGGGVAAAAYTRSLPSPVQSFFHDVLGPIGVPAPAPRTHHHHHNRPVVAGAATSVVPTAPTPSSQAASGSSAPSAGPAHQSPRPQKRPAAAVGAKPSPSVTPSVSPTVVPTPTTTPTPSPSPSPTGPAGDPSTWTMSATASQRVVPVHQGVQISGVLTDAAGQPVADHPVVLREHIPGTPGWQRAAASRTDDNGSVELALDDLTENHVVVLGAGHGVHSSPLRIIVKPAVSVSVSPGADGTSYVASVSADGGEAGDIVKLFKHAPQGWTQIGEATLDSSGSASFSVPAPQQKKRYVVRLPATKLHAAAAAVFVLQPSG